MLLIPYGVWYNSSPNEICLLVKEKMVKELALQEALLKRIKRIEGQVRGIQKMVDEKRDCESIITQLGAIRSGVEGVAALVLSNYMKVCFSQSNGADSSKIDSLARAISIWGKVRVGDRR